MKVSGNISGSHFYPTDSHNQLLSISSNPITTTFTMKLIMIISLTTLAINSVSTSGPNTKTTRAVKDGNCLAKGRRSTNSAQMNRRVDVNYSSDQNATSPSSSSKTLSDPSADATRHSPQNPVSPSDSAAVGSANPNPHPDGGLTPAIASSPGPDPSSGHPVAPNTGNARLGADSGAGLLAVTNRSILVSTLSAILLAPLLL
ncbi:hypothetical protein H4Q26_014243 [Puccinia striiformis f. sp. tritici PST-130]|nr:hypothetical protein H4Q26_014243 [Puccinia striiformis f. sp. tritici PST-130]